MKKIDRFRILQTLAQGPAATLFKAEQRLPGDATRTVLLKVFPAHGATPRPSAELHPFHEEIRLLAGLDGHPHIAPLHATAITDNIPWLATECLPGTLADTLSEAPAEPAGVARLIEHVAQALAAIHALDPTTLHNDLKPANILIDAMGNYKVTDFGIAALPAEHKTLQATAVQYAAPELFSREFGAPRPSSDLYALGHIAYELALGTRLHRRELPAVYGDERNPGKSAPPARWMAWHCSSAARAAPVHQLREDFPPALGELIEKLMRKSPADRYASATDLLADLKQATAPAAPSAEPAAPVASDAEVERPRHRIADRQGDKAAAGQAERAPDVIPLSPPPLVPLPASSQPPAAGSLGQSRSDGDLEQPPAALQPAQNLRYYVKLRGRITGPFDLPTLQRQARQGLISRLHQVSVDQVNWQNAAKVPGLFGNPPPR